MIILDLFIRQLSPKDFQAVTKRRDVISVYTGMSKTHFAAFRW